MRKYTYNFNTFNNNLTKDSDSEFFLTGDRLKHSFPLQPLEWDLQWRKYLDLEFLNLVEYFLIDIYKNDTKFLKPNLLRNKNRKIALSQILTKTFYHGYLNEAVIGVHKTKSYYNSFRSIFPWYTRTNIIDTMNRLLENEYIQIKPGFYDPRVEFGRITRIWFTPKSIELFQKFESIRIEKIVKPVKTLQLKNKESESIEIKETPFTINQREFAISFSNLLNRNEFLLTITNEQNDKFYNSLKNILGPERVELVKSNKNNSIFEIKNKFVYRSFNNDFEQGGRFYTSYFQNLPKEIRKTITINGDETIELDFSAIHPSLLYSLEGLKIPDDCYFPTEKFPRKYLKLIMLTVINANDLDEAIQSGCQTIIKLIKKERYYVKGEITHLYIMKLMQHLVEKNLPISKYFSTGFGIKLQKYDSDVMELILNHFNDRNIPCLPVHDSVIISKQYKEELLNVMISSYKIIMKTNDCPNIS
ncbi:MAG: hypothetical protein ACTSWK_07250 [Promethearchaeota archaeon]